MSAGLVKILVIRLSSIGDIVQASGIPRNLANAFPGAEIHWLVRSDNETLIKFNTYVTRTISFDRAQGLKGWLSLCRQLKKEGYTHVYDAHNNLRSHILCWHLKPPFFTRRSKNRINRALLFWLKWNLFGKNWTAVGSYLNPLKKWNIPLDSQGSQLFMDKQTTQKALSLVPQTPSPVVALAPATAWPKKTWPQSYWKSLLTMLLQKTNYQFVLLGGPNDSFCQDLILDPKRIHSLQGKINLIESAAVIGQCRALVVADTGLLHMAESLSVDTVAIMGPTPFGDPYRKTSRMLKENLWCQPCSKDGRGVCYNPTYQKCMTEIKPERVGETLQEIIDQGPPS